MDGLILLAFLVGLALAAPRWGWDSRDGLDSPEWGRRAAWLRPRSADCESYESSGSLGHSSIVLAAGPGSGVAPVACLPALDGV